MKKLLIAFLTAAVCMMNFSAFAEPEDEFVNGGDIRTDEEYFEDENAQIDENTQIDEIDENDKEVQPKTETTVEDNPLKNLYDKITEKAEDIKISKEQLEIKKAELKKLKDDTKEYITEIKTMFGSADAQAKKEILSEIARVKKELKDTSIGVFVKGIEVDFDKYDGIKPVIESDRTLVPLRAVVEACGADVAWDESTQTITISKDDTVVNMQLGNLTAKINGVEAQLEVAPKTIDDRTVVPIRFILETFNYSVDWDNDSQTIIIE